MKITAPRRELLPDGIYPASLTRLEQRDGTSGSYWHWLFDVSVNGRAVEISAVSSTLFGPKSKARGWAEALLGRKIADGEEFDTDDLLGLACTLVLKTVERDGTLFNHVDTVTRSKPTSERLDF